MIMKILRNYEKELVEKHVNRFVILAIMFFVFSQAVGCALGNDSIFFWANKSCGEVTYTGKTLDFANNMYSALSVYTFFLSFLLISAIDIIEFYSKKAKNLRKQIDEKKSVKLHD